MYARMFFCLLLSVAFLSYGLAQDRAAEANRMIEEAERLTEEADGLRRARSAESRRAAIEKYQAAIAIFSRLGSRDREANAYNNIGVIHKRLGEFEQSIVFFEKALHINRAINNAKGEFFALLNLGQSLRYLNRQPEAGAAVKRALALSRELGDREKEAAALNELGVFYYRGGEIDKCLAIFEAAASIFAELDRPVRRASILNNIGLINRLFGNLEAAVANYQTALEIFRRAEKPDGEADVLLNLAAVYGESFRAVEAMDHYDLALSIYRETGNRQRQAVVLNSIGVFYVTLGDYYKALDHYTRAAELANSIGNRRQYGAALKNSGLLYLNLDDPDKALRYLNKALEISREVKNPRDEGLILKNIGLAHEKNGELGKSKRFLYESLKILRRIGNRFGEGQALYSIGSVLHKTGDTKAAMDFYDRALAISRELTATGEEAKIHFGRARLERDAGAFDRARQSVEQAIEKIEAMRAGIPGPDLRTKFFALGRDAYDFHIDLLMRQNDREPSTGLIAAAFDLSERARARSLLESLLESNTEIRQGLDAGLLDRERRLQNQINARERYRMTLKAGKAAPEKIAKIEADLRFLLDELRKVRIEIRSRSPAYAALVRPQPLGLAEIRRDVLDDETVLFEYALGADSSYLWIVTREGVKIRRLPAREWIAAAVRRFYRALNRRGEMPGEERPAGRRARFDAADPELAAAGRELSLMILPPDLAKLGGKRLAIVADGLLQYVPFGALTIDNAVPAEHAANRQTAARDEIFLIENHEIVYLPSASTLAVLRNRKRPPARNRIAVLADPVFSAADARVKAKARKNAGQSPDEAVVRLRSQLRSDFSRLRFSRREAAAISRLVNDGEKFVALDFAASRRSLNDENISRSRLLHFATHGIVMSEFPELSGIVLSLVTERGETQDGFLRLHDIYNLRLAAELVVLSACDTALGREVKGEGIVGLTRGFMYAGADRVVASLWKVEDRATAELMEKFYRAMIADGQRPAAALRTAQIEMLGDERRRHPFFWAAFTLQGEWR